VVIAVPAADVGSFFDARAGSYDSAYDLIGWGGYVLRTRLQAVLAMIGEGSGDVLDAGMGPGRLCEQLAARGYRVSGVDLSEQMVRAARARLPEAAGRLVQGRIDALPFSDASFDVVAATGVLEYVDSVPVALRELARVLRPGGHAVISLPNRGSMHASSRRLTDPLARAVRRALSGSCAELARRDRIPALDSFADALAGAGLQLDATRYVAALVLPAPVDRLFPRAVEQLGQALEHRRRVRRLAATQIVVRATKPRSPSARQGSGDLRVAARGS
jgi:ubiquinone/menaquinone biosynthesis C-methylase UbiE